MDIFKFSKVKGSSIKELKNIKVNKNLEYSKYKSSLIYLKNGSIYKIGKDGEEETMFKSKIENCDIDSNNYIDITTDEKIMSLNEDGTSMFNSYVSRETKKLISINKSKYLTYYKSGDKNYIEIQNSNKEVIKNIEFEGKITNVNSFDSNVLAVGINTDEKLISKLVMYDDNGNEKESKEIEDLVLDVVAKENIYLILSDSVIVLDKGLKELKTIELNNINQVSDIDNKIYISSRNGDLGYIEGRSYHKLRSSNDNMGVEALKEDYIRYSKNNIYNSENKKIYNSENDIKDVVYIDEKSIAVISDENIVILNI